MSNKARASDASVTGVASGSLGTGTALDDTQVYSIEALATADHPDEPGADDVVSHAEPIGHAPQAVAGLGPIADLAPVAAPAVPPAPARPPRARHRVTGGYRVGVLTAAVVALVAIAAVLTMRDGGLAGGSGTGRDLAGAASFPPLPSAVARKTAPPAPKPPSGGHGHGHGHGPH